MTIKTIIFDIGGVFFLHDFHKMKSYMLKKHNFSILLSEDYSKKIQRKYKGLSTGKISLKKVFRDLSGQKNITKILKNYKRAYTNYQWINYRLLRLLKKLKKKYQLFALTNVNDFHFELNTKQGFYKDFQKVYASSELKIKKPHKKAFLIVLKDNNLNPKEVLFIDDDQENLNMAKELGMKTLIFKNNRQFFNDLKKRGIK